MIMQKCIVYLSLEFGTGILGRQRTEHPLHPGSRLQHCTAAVRLRSRRHRMHLAH